MKLIKLTEEFKEKWYNFTEEEVKPKPVIAMNVAFFICKKFKNSNQLLSTYVRDSTL